MTDISPPVIGARLLGPVRHLAPSVASASQKFSQLAVLWALTAASTGASKAQLLTGFGLIVTFLMISDSGAGTFLLARRGEQLTTTAFGRACNVHIALSGVGVAACAAFLLVVLRGPVDGLTIAVLVALSLMQIEDNLSRVVRYPLLNLERNLTFAWPELMCSTLKVALAGWAGLAGSLYPLLALPLVSLIVIVLAVRPVRAALHVDHSDPPAVRAILTFGVTGAINATYTQLPLIFASLILSNEHTAVLATMMRIFQALEIVSGTLFLQAIPRYAAGRRTLGRDWLLMTGGAIVFALVFLPFLPLAGRILELPLGFGLGVLYAGAFVARSGGYLVYAYSMGTGQIDLRLRLTAAAAVVMVPVVALLVIGLGLIGAGVAAFLSEALLAAVVATGLRRWGRPTSLDPAVVSSDPAGLDTPVTAGHAQDPVR